MPSLRRSWLLVLLLTSRVVFAQSQATDETPIRSVDGRFAAEPQFAEYDNAYTDWANQLETPNHGEPPQTFRIVFKRRESSGDYVLQKVASFPQRLRQETIFLSDDGATVAFVTIAPTLELFSTNGQLIRKYEQQDLVTMSDGLFGGNVRWSLTQENRLRLTSFGRIANAMREAGFLEVEMATGQLVSTPTDHFPSNRVVMRNEPAPKSAALSKDAWCADATAPQVGEVELVSTEEFLANAMWNRLPIYPTVAQKVRIKGLVRVMIIVDETGRVSCLDIVKPLPFGMDTASAEAIKEWRFRRFIRHGRAVKVASLVTFSFERMSDEEWLMLHPEAAPGD